MSTNVARKNEFIYYLNVLITLFWFFGFGYLPAFGGLSKLGMQALGIFIGFLWGWSFCAMIWPSIVGLLAMAWTGYYTVEKVFSVAFGSSLTLQIFSMLILIEWMTQSGASQNVAKKIMSIKFAKGKPWRVILLCFFVGFIVSCMTNGTTGILVAWGFLYGVLKVAGSTKEDKFTNQVLFGCVLSGMAGAISFPWQPTAICFTNAYTTTLGLDINALKFFLCRFPIGILFVVLWWAFTRWVLRPDITMFEQHLAAIGEFKSEKMTTEMKASLAAMAILVLGLFLPGLLPKTWAPVALLSSWGIVGVSGFAMALFSVIKFNINGEKKVLMNVGTLARRMNWDLIFVMSVTQPITSLLETDEAGVFNLFLTFLNPLTEKLGGLMFVLVVVIFVGLLTQISHNMILAAVITPILLPIAVELGINPMALMLATMMPIQIAIMTPAASGNAALMWGNTDWFEKKQLAKLCLIGFIFVVVFSVITMPYFMLLFN